MSKKACGPREVFAALGLDETTTHWGRDSLAIAGDAELWSQIQEDGQKLYAILLTYGATVKAIHPSQTHEPRRALARREGTNPCRKW